MRTLRTAVEDGVLVVTLNRPERLNAMNRLMFEELGETFERCEQAAVLVTGEGRAFCSGADLRELPPETEAFRAQMRVVQRMVEAMDACPAGLVAHVNGPAVGGGFCLAALCDVVCAEPQATFSVNQATRGMVPDMGAMWLLPRQLGELAARRLLLLGETFGAGAAQELGIVTRVCGREETMALARELAANRDCVRLTKAGLRLARHATLRETLAFEIEAEVEAFRSERVLSSIRSFTGG